MKFFTVPLFLLLLTVQLLAADRWGSFSDPFPIRDAIPMGNNGVLLATDGGIRFRSVDMDIAYHSKNGLETSSFYALVSSDIGIFAVSNFGLVVQFFPEQSSWRVVNRSYVGNGVYVIPGEVKISGHVLTIPFEDRLAFLDLSKGSSVLTVRRLGTLDLSGSPIRKLAVHGDSLYVKTERATFARAMSWDNLSADVRLSDPNTWMRLPENQAVEEFESVDKSKVVVDGKVLSAPILYGSDTSLVKWVVEGAQGYYLMGSSLIAFCPKGSTEVSDLTYHSGFPMGAAYEIRSLPTGSVVAASENGQFSYGSLNGWETPIVAYNEMGSYLPQLKTLSVLPDGYMFFHIWGWVYQIYSQFGAQLEYEFTPRDGLCFDNYLENYSVSWMSVPAPDNSGFLTTSASNRGYSLVYFTKDGEVRCASHVGPSPAAGAMYAMLDEDGSWLIYVAGKSGMNYTSDGSLDVFKFPAPKANGGELANGDLKSYKMEGPAPIDMAYDSLSRTLWLASVSNLYYFDIESDTLMTPTSMNGLRMADYTSLETDVHGNLWVGTANKGAYRLSTKRKSPDTLSVEHYTSKNGLLNDNILDLAIDPVNGVAWFVHQNGVSYYQRNDLKDARANMTDSAKVEVKAYPVPFRPNIHARFTIEGVSESSVVSLYNRGGALIKSFRNGDLLGGKLEWDGRDRSGKLVAPGVYYYVVNDGSKNEKGKFIIIH